MKIFDLVKFLEPNYIFLKITPSISIRNYNSDNILKIIATLYRSFRQRVDIINKSLVIQSEAKIAFYIYMEKTKVEFFFIVPDAHYNLFRDKIYDSWSNKIDIDIVPSLPIINLDCTKYFLKFKKEDAMSLVTDKRNNILITSELGNIYSMQDNDKAGIFFNFIPTSQSSWRLDYENTMQKLLNQKSIDKNKLNLWDMFYIGINKLVRILEIGLECLSLSSPKETHKYDIVLSEATKNKRTTEVIDTQVICMYESNDKLYERNMCRNMCHSFQCLNAGDGDGYNELTWRRLKMKNVNLLDTIISGADVMKISPREGQNFLSLPGRELLEEHKIIECKNILETQVPKMLQDGYIWLGTNWCKNNPTEAYLRDNYDQGSFPVVELGEQGSGKTTFLVNYVKCVLTRGESAVVIDFIKNCELAEAIEKIVPKDKLIVIDMSDIKNLQGIGYNEFVPKSDHPMDIVEVANKKSLYVQMLINAVNVNGDPLSSNMDKYLNSACNIVFLNKDASLKDVMRCLSDHVYRKLCIDNIPTSLLDIYEDDIQAMQELDEVKDKEIVGTKYTKVEGISHRVNVLKKDFRLKLMFNKGTKDNIDLVNAFEEGKIVIFKMPQEYFATPYSRNVIVTYLFTKIWAAQIIRGSLHLKPLRNHTIIDEIFQARTTMQMIANEEVLPTTRKFMWKFVLTAQNLKQIELIADTLYSAGASYLFLKGSGKGNFNLFKEELYPYTLDDIEALPQYSSLNLINYEEGRAKFITKLPYKNEPRANK
jgi:hypothetical protein